MKVTLGKVLVIGLFLSLLAAAVLLLDRQEVRVQAQLVVPTSDPRGFARATGPRTFSFPDDHGAHPDYQTEWWYYTGNLETEQGRHFGYQLTFFRRALVPAEQRANRSSAWATDQVYMAHLALTDVAAGEHQAYERLARGAAGLAGVEASPFHIWLEDWEVREVGDDTYRLRAAQEDLALDLLLVDRRGPILQGDRGYSQKGAEPGNASYYYSLIGIETSGTVQVGEARYTVRGRSWMDHEFSTSALAVDQVGWDWFALQLDDGSALMVFQIRRQDGSIDPYASGTFVAADGTVHALRRDDFSVEVEDTWRSPHSRARYPSRWRVAVPAVGLDLRLEPYLANQEMRLSYTYWEGAVWVEGTAAGDPVSGSGYVEMTGYAGSMEGQF